jgi:hypothetical protein
MTDELKITEEENLLIRLCRLNIDDGDNKKIRSSIPFVKDWDYFKNLANSHGVAALVSRNIEKLDLIQTIPADVVSFLKAARMMSLSRNTFNTESILGVLQLLNSQNIKTVLLKGLALENTIYGNEGLRQMSDVDILVGKKDSLKARKILMENGFDSLPVKSALHKPIISNIGKHLPSLIKNGTSVDIHNDLFGAKKENLTERLIDSSYVIDLKGEKVFIPQPQIFFLYLVRHLHSHEMTNESQLRLYSDLAVMLEKYPEKIMDYDLLRYASDAGISKILANYLGLLREFWEISFPEWLNDYIDKWYRQESINKFIFFLKSPKDNPPIDKAAYYRDQVHDMPGLHTKILFVLGDIFPSLSFMKNRYGCSGLKALIYYPHRLGKVLWLFRRRT